MPNSCIAWATAASSRSRKWTRSPRAGFGRGVDAQRIGLVDHLGGLKDATDAAAKLAQLGADYDVDYIEPELSLRQQLLMQLRSESLRMGQMAGLIAPRSELERVLDPVLEQARAIALLNDPRGLYAYCWCRQPHIGLKALAGAR